MQKLQAVDIETTSLDPTRGSLLSVAVSDGRRTVAWWIESPDDLKAAREALGASEGHQAQPIVVHFCPMEGGWMQEFFGCSRERTVSSLKDTALIAARLDPGQPTKLASVAARRLPEFSGWKTETESLLVDSPSMLELPKEETLRRNAVDAFVTAKLHEEM